MLRTCNIPLTCNMANMHTAQVLIQYIRTPSTSPSFCLVFLSFDLPCCKQFCLSAPQYFLRIVLLPVCNPAGNSFRFREPWLQEMDIGRYSEFASRSLEYSAARVTDTIHVCVCVCACERVSADL